jgi:predicted nucleic acid-binding protein
VILVDTSVWIDHLRQGDPELQTALVAGNVLMHPFVVGELACGNLDQRKEILHLLQQLPAASVATVDEAFGFIETRHLMGRGIGYVDVHLLASTALTPGARLWTRDQRLARIAEDLMLELGENR